MSNRIYNILFHTHTVSGLLISVGLYVIFFAGSFAFFKDEIISWERNEPIQEADFGSMDIDAMITSLDQKYDTYGRDISFHKYDEAKRISVNISASKDTTTTEEAKGRRGDFFYINTDTHQTYDYAGNYTIGEFLYRLHFLAQLNLYGRSGYLIAGIISFFFLFAIVTGVIVHWNKIISNFYVFRPKEKFKNIWTDAHTALGIIGLPYQFVFAVTGVFFIVGATVMAPPVASIMYDGDTEKMYDDFGYGNTEYPMAMLEKASPTDINSFVEKAKSYWPEFNIRSIDLYNYGDANMHVGISGSPAFSAKFMGEGELVFNASTGEIVHEKNPFNNTSYADGALGVITRLHFGDFGGRSLKVVYFILGIISCFVIITGILIWLVARDKKHIAEKKRKFNAWVGWIFLAICLTMYPVTAFTFLGVKLTVTEFDASRMTAIYHIFFYSWLALIVLFSIKRDNFFTNKYTLILGAILGFLVPLANGFVSGNWIWKTFSKGYHDIFFIDVFWLTTSIITLIVALILKRRSPESANLVRGNKEKFRKSKKVTMSNYDVEGITQ